MRIQPLDDAEYLSLTTFRRDGTPVPTPIWFAGSNGRFVFITDLDSGKVKRLRNHPRVEVAACNGRGRVHGGAAVLAATARLLDGVAAEEGEKSLRKKYGLKWKTLGAMRRVTAKVLRREPAATVVGEITLTEAI